MIKVLIVDDESIIRSGLKQVIPWEINGFSVVGTAQNGIDAYMICTSSHVDLIISDIKMPKMDGLQLLEKVHTNFPNIVFIMISGHDEFIYAQKALNLGASAYILKPLDPDEILIVLRKIKATISLRDNLIISNLMRDNLLGSYQAELYASYTDLLESINTAHFCVITILCDNFNYIINAYSKIDINDYIKSFHQIVKNAGQNSTIEISPAMICLCFFGDQKEDVINKAKLFAGSILNILTNELSKHFSIGIGNTHKGLFDINLSYIESLKALNLKYIKGGENIFSFKENQDNGSSYFYPLLKYEDKIINNMLCSNKESIKNILSDVLSQASNLKITISNIKLFIQNIIYKAFNSLLDADIQITDIIENPDQTISFILENSEIEQMFESLFQFLLRILDLLSPRLNVQARSIIQKVKMYVEENYNNSKLSLVIIARYVNLHPAYLSTFFSKYEKTNLIDYLTSVRIEKAKFLIKHSSNKISNISSMVGYQNSTYFSTLFKKMTGYTPSEYRGLL